MTETPRKARWAMPTPSPTDTAEDYWEGFYRGLERPADYVPRPNPLLLREVTELSPGTALDLGCGGGGDAIWLAARGWRVTAADVSATVLEAAARFAADAGVAGRVDWQRHDLSRSFPSGWFDLVSAQFLHSPVATEGERDSILARAAAAVAPGGVLLVAGHAGWPSWLKAEEAPIEFNFPTTADVRESLGIDAPDWVVDTEESVTREVTAPDGEVGTRPDNVLRMHRLR